MSDDKSKDHRQHEVGDDNEQRKECAYPLPHTLNRLGSCALCTVECVVLVVPICFIRRLGLLGTKLTFGITATTFKPDVAAFTCYAIIFVDSDQRITFLTRVTMFYPSWFELRLGHAQRLRQTILPFDVS